MLLIAQPKSASTSLTKTIALIGRLSYRLGIPKNKIDIPCKEFTNIQNYHNNMIQRSPKFLEQVIKGRRTIFKEHILPTERHLSILRKLSGHRVVILLRNPEDSENAYSRLKIKKEVVDKIGIELKIFHDRYMWYASNKKNTLVVYYEDLIINYIPTMKKVLRHYNIKAAKIRPLLKCKYTGVGVKRVIDRTT